MSFSGTYLFAGIVPDGDCLVYAAINRVTGDFYLGATEKGLAARRQKHLANAARGQAGKFYTAIRKYGADNFDFIPLSECRDFWDALDFERVCIALMLPRYNLTAGGGGIKGYRHTEEARALMSATRKGRPGPWSNGMSEKMKNRLRAANAATIGKPRTEREVQARQKNARLANEGRRKPVICVTDGEMYGSVTEAAAAYGLTNGRVSYHCGGDHKSRRGLQFRYAERPE
jgi:group I intron endonuclease